MGIGTLALIMLVTAVCAGGLALYNAKRRLSLRWKQISLASGSVAFFALLLACLFALQYRDGANPEYDATISTLKSQLSAMYHVLDIYQDNTGMWHAHVSDKLNASCTGTLDLHVSGNSLYGSGAATYADLSCIGKN